MIFYNVWFSFRANADGPAELDKVKAFLESLKASSKIHGYRLLTNSGNPSKSRLPPYQVIVEFVDNVQFGLPFAEVSQTGIRSGLHGVMIENVEDFRVEVFRDI